MNVGDIVQPYWRLGPGASTFPGVVDPIGIRVTDQNGGQSQAILRIYTSAPDADRPVIISRPTTEYVLVGAPWNYTLTVDSGRLPPTNQLNTYTMPVAPSGATITQITGNSAGISFTPTAGQVGTIHFQIKVVDTVSNSCDIQQIALIVDTIGGGG